jgi:5'-nucleotidase
MDLSGQEVVNALEDAVANHLDALQSNGSHPYAAGLRWDLDMSKAKGSRFSNVQVRDKTTGAWSAIDLAKTYVLATNDFIASGKDGYTALGTAYTAGRFVNTYLLYTQTFADWVTLKGTVARPARAEYSHQTVITKAGATLP